MKTEEFINLIKYQRDQTGDKCPVVVEWPSGELISGIPEMLSTEHISVGFRAGKLIIRVES